ncbi:MAG: hypothetical protein AB3N33_06615 [Puniceicoccaceae bacterium]
MTRFSPFPSKLLVVALSIYGLTGVASAIEAEIQPANHTLRSEHGWVSAGLFFADFSTSARLDGTGGLIGTSVDLEDDLGMDSKSELWTVSAGLNFSQRWRFEAEYLDHKRASLTELSSDIDWGNQVLGAGINAIARFEVAITRLALGYDFVQKDDRLLGASIGLHWVKSLAAIQGEVALAGTVPSDDPGFSLYRFDFDSEAISDEKLPLPNVGLYGVYALGKNWRLNGRIDVFMLDLGEWGGQFLSAYADLSYFAENGFYCGAGLQYLVINVDYTSNQLEGRIHYRHFGPRIDVGFRF